MRPRLLVPLALLVLVARAQAGDSMDSERVKEALRYMQNASTWYHDDLFGEYAGFQHYARKDYPEALRYFELGAYYADKPSQISLGLMYLKGEGVTADPIAALAWIDLAAERGYPAYVATRDRVSATLTAGQVAKAAQLRTELAQRYGDAVAKPRLAEELAAGLRQKTGSRAGFDVDVQVLSPELFVHRWSPQGQTVCPGGFSSDECWKPDQYVAMRDRQLNATVKVGPASEQK